MPIQRLGANKPTIVRGVGTTARVMPVVGRMDVDSTDDAAIAAALGSGATAAVLSASTAALLTDRGGIVFLDSYPREGAETDDSPRLGRALTDAAVLGAKVVQLGAATYTLATQVDVTTDYLTIRGAGKRATVLVSSTDTIALNVTGDYVSVEDLTVQCTTTARTVYPVKFDTTNHGAVRRCYFDGDAAGSRRSGVYFTAGSMGAVEDSTFNHSCIRVETWDVKISRCYIWGMSCDFCIGIFNGAGNTTVENVDVVPPLASNANGVAGILIDGASGNPFNTKLSDVYLDGNPSLNTRQGIYVGDGAAATVMSNINANHMDAECIVIDSAYNVLIDGYSGHSNNDDTNAAPEILVTQTGAQAVENVRIRGAQFLQTAAVSGTAAPAVEVDSSVSASQVSIHEFDVKQPSGGGGYSLPEIQAPAGTSIAGRGELSVYSATGSQTVLSGAAGATVNLGSPYPMAYAPTPSQIKLASASGQSLPAHRIAVNNGGNPNQIFVTFATALAADIVLHWDVSLRRA